MRYVLLLAVCLLGVGCATPATVLVAARGNVRDLRLIQDTIIEKLPEPLRTEWTENLVTFVVRGESLTAYLDGAKAFDQTAREASEWERINAKRGE